MKSQTIQSEWVNNILNKIKKQIISANHLKKINGSFCIVEVIKTDNIILTVRAKFGSQDEGGGDAHEQFYTINLETLEVWANLTDSEAIDILRSISEDTVIDSNWEDYLEDDIILKSAVLLIADKETYRQVYDSFEGFFIKEFISHFLRRKIKEHGELLKRWELFTKGDEVDESLKNLYEISNKF